MCVWFYTTKLTSFKPIDFSLSLSIKLNKKSRPEMLRGGSFLQKYGMLTKQHHASFSLTGLI